MSNKKKYILIGVGALILISLLSSIGGGDSEVAEQKPIILKAAQTEIKGDLKGCYELVDKDYKPKYDNIWGYAVNVELKRTSAQLPHDRKEITIFPDSHKSSAKYCAGFGIEILDADGNVIDKKNANATPYSWDEMTAAVQLLPEETTTIKYYFKSLHDAASIRVTSMLMENEERKSATKTESKSKSESKSESGSLSGLLKEMTDLSDDEDLKDDLKDAEAALEIAGKTMEVAGDMLDLLK
ncbi:MAG: hypothetical protein J6U95_05330 [Alistipes sp.]|nr:hypothetical protein [Alistipes sp.]